MNGLVGRNMVVAIGIICVLLAASLIGALINYTSIISARDSTITNQDSTISDLNSQITSLNSQISENNNTISSLNAHVSGQDSQIDTLTIQKDQLQTWLNSNITALNTQITNLQNQISSNNSTITNLQNQVNSSNSQITALQSQVSSSDSQIMTLQSQASSDSQTIATLQGQLATANSQVVSLTSTVTTLQSQVDNLTAIINQSQSAKLKTLVFHVCEKDWTHLPDANYTYNQLLALTSNKYNVLLKPEYDANENLTAELIWITANFGGPHGIPIMLDVFGSGSGDAPIPQFSTDAILAAMAVSNVQWIAINEVVSWHIEHLRPFPTAYVTSILNFSREHNLKVYWTEWKAGAFKTIQTYIKGYEDIVTVSFSTNSGELEPAGGFTLVSQMFQHWGGSVQAWYWTTRYGSDPLNMPASLLIQHTLSAKNAGAELLEFEPYWYFFDNGQPKENLRLLEIMLT